MFRDNNIFLKKISIFKSLTFLGLIKLSKNNNLIYTACNEVAWVTGATL
jgi:hypothetical protein